MQLGEYLLTHKFSLSAICWEPLNFVFVHFLLCCCSVVVNPGDPLKSSNDDEIHDILLCTVKQQIQLKQEQY